MYVLGWTHSTGDPDNGLFNLFLSSSHGSPGNRMFYINNELDRLIEQSRAQTDRNTRAALFAEIQQIIRDDAPHIFIHQGEELVAARADLRGLYISPAGTHRLNTVYFSH